MNMDEAIFGILFLFTFGMMFIGGCTAVSFMFPDVGSGSHTGVITATEQGGVFFKTMSVYIKTDTSSTQEDRYCVTNRHLYNAMKEMESQKQKVTVSFEWGNIQKFPWNCAGTDQAIITAIQQVKA